MLGAAVAVARKDLKLALSGAQGLVQTVLLGLLLIFIMSLSREPGELSPPLAAAASEAVTWSVSRILPESSASMISSMVITLVTLAGARRSWHSFS